MYVLFFAKTETETKTKKSRLERVEKDEGGSSDRQLRAEASDKQEKSSRQIWIARSIPLDRLQSFVSSSQSLFFRPSCPFDPP